MMEYFDIDSQQNSKFIDVGRIASSKADASIVKTNEIAKGTTLEASSCCQPMEYMSSCKRPVAHQEQTVLQGQVALKETLVSVTVASEGALMIKKSNGQKQNRRKKIKVKLSVRLKRTLNSRNWRKSQFHRNLFHKNRNPGFQKGQGSAEEKGS